MSKGLGTTERKIIEYLKGQKDQKTMFLGNIAYYVQDSNRDTRPTPATYQATCRAIRNLAKKGIVKSTKYTPRLIYHDYKYPCEDCKTFQWSDDCPGRGECEYKIRLKGGTSFTHSVQLVSV